MSIRIMAKVWDNGPEDRAELLVLLALADFANDEGRCWPSMSGIAQKARITERGAQKIVRRLEETGWLKIATGGGRGCKNSYLITPRNPEREAVNTEANPERETVNEAETPNGEAINPERRFTRTVIEPSEEEEPLCVSPSKKPPKRGCQLPDGWVPSERNVSDARTRNFSDEEISHEADRFADHHRARGTVFKDWDAAWRTWLGNARKFGSRGGMAGPARSGGYGQGSSIASIVARRRAEGAV